jgi:hypothetical protein
MSRSRPPSTLSLPSDRKKKPRTGYVRSSEPHIGTEWRFEVWSEEQKIALVSILTADGPVQVALNRAELEILWRNLEAFLLGWPEDRI